MPPKRTTPYGYERAHKLRKAPTPAEAKLWEALRGNKLSGVSFRRQHAIGQYVVDFCSLKKKLVIELDGSQHMEQADYDTQRTEFLESQGFKVMRFWNTDVLKNTDMVMETIIFALKDR